MMVAFIFQKGLDPKNIKNIKSHELEVDRKRTDSFRLQSASGGENRVCIYLNKSQAIQIKKWMENEEWCLIGAEIDGHEREIREQNLNIRRNRFIEFGGCKNCMF